MSNPNHIGLLTYCVDSLQLTDGERSLMREILLAAAGDNLPSWGSRNMQRVTDVRLLFGKCLEQICA